VTAVTLVGLATDYCVAYSALDARAKLGFKATCWKAPAGPST
jgi:nicotinamidase-related amidase